MTWIIVGLGNPGEEYEGTRHNAGRSAVEYFAKKIRAAAWKDDTEAHAAVTKGSVGARRAALVLPNTYMNKSGASLKKFVASTKAAERLVVVYDDLDLPLGKLKVSFDRGSGGHRGLESIIRAVKTKKFTRVRIGVSPSTRSGTLRKPSGEKEVNDFILGAFRARELDDLAAVFKKAAAALECIVAEGVERAMNVHN